MGTGLAMWKLCYSKALVTTQDNTAAGLASTEQAPVIPQYPVS